MTNAADPHVVSSANSEPNTKHIFVDYDQPHRKRRKELMDKHPEVKELMNPRPDSAYYVWGCVALNTALAAALHTYDAPWWVIFLASYTIGAVVDHALWVLIHDLTHNAVFESIWWNNVYHLIANLPIIFPAAISFKYYHGQHHSHLNEAYGDPDLPGPLENWLFGHSAIGKAGWLFAFPFIQIVRTIRYTPTLGGLEKWAAVNWVLQLAYNYAAWHFWGWKGLGFLFASSMFAIGLHPLGARWVAEHYSVKPTQETYSYYGFFNTFMLNIGYHNEHHDLPSVPWQNLPELHRRAPEFYNSLWYHTSYVDLLYDFICNSAFTLHSRVVRLPKEKPAYVKRDAAPAGEKVE